MLHEYMLGKYGGIIGIVGLLVGFGYLVYLGFKQILDEVPDDVVQKKD